jgi:mRNA interferase RelE/StbE
VTYSVFLAPPAERQLKKLPPQLKQQIVPVLQRLGGEPRPSGAIKLRGADDVWRVRTGSYRILYQIEDKKLTVLVLKIDHRRQVYKDDS